MGLYITLFNHYKTVHMKQIHFFSTTFILCLIIMSTTWANPRQIIIADDGLQETIGHQLQQGRWELVMIWATYCHLCKEDFNKLATFIKDNAEVPLTIIGVVADGLEQQEKTSALVENNKLDYVHILTDFENANSLYKNVTDKKLMGTPSYLLYDTQNKLVAFNPNAIDLDALEIMVYQ